MARVACTACLAVAATPLGDKLKNSAVTAVIRCVGVTCVAGTLFDFARMVVSQDQEFNQTHMINVQSLKTRIALQFALIIAPIAILLGIQAIADARRSANIEHAFRLHQASIAARDNFKLFLDGAADSVDTGKLSARALEGLRTAAQLTRSLPDNLENAGREPGFSAINRLLAAVEHDARLQSLLALRPGIAQVRSEIDSFEVYFERASNHQIEDALVSARNQQYVVGVATIFTSCLRSGSSGA